VIIDDETYFVRSLTIGELQRLDALEPEKRTGFVIGCTLCDSDGQPEIYTDVGETDAEYSARVLMELSDVPSESIRQLSEGVAAIGKVPAMATIAKN
jgi:hypothetical protein